MSDIAKIKTQQHKLPSINRAKYGKRSGLEGPFMTKSGQVVYYDHKKGQYLDPDKDMYLSYDDWKKLSEDAPVNATGTAVAGTGDDSSTVVVKKKKPMQDKLMRRMGIKEAIDRAIPDLEYPKDEIRERVNQLKELALGEATPDPIKYGPDKVAKAMAIAVKSDGQYSKAVKDIEKIAKDLSKVSTIARALKTANEDVHAGAKIVYEQIKGLKNKAEKTGMPYGVLKKVYDRGMAAWRGGHRPGTTQQQWAFARVNSFVTKSSGTWGGADKDLAKQVKG